MIVGNLRKSYFQSSASDVVPIPVNNSTSAGSNIWINTWGEKQFFLNGTYTGYNFQKYNANNPTKGYYVAVGYGDTAESSSDYKLANMQGIDSTLLSHKYGYVKKDPANGVALQVESVYENSGSSDVTVKEMGLIANINNSNGDNDWQMKNFLIARKVIPSVTLHPGDIYKFTYKIDF